MTAELFYIFPGEGLPLTEGTLVTASGEEVEGVWMKDVFPDDDARADPLGGRPGAVQVQFVLMVRALPPVSDDQISKAIRGMLEIHQSTGSEIEPEGDHIEPNAVRN